MDRRPALHEEKSVEISTPDIEKQRTRKKWKSFNHSSSMTINNNNVIIIQIEIIIISKIIIKIEIIIINEIIIIGRFIERVEGRNGRGTKYCFVNSTLQRLVGL